MNKEKFKYVTCVQFVAIIYNINAISYSYKLGMFVMCFITSMNKIHHLLLLKRAESTKYSLIIRGVHVFTVLFITNSRTTFVLFQASVSRSMIIITRSRKSIKSSSIFLYSQVKQDYNIHVPRRILF